MPDGRPDTDSVDDFLDHVLTRFPVMFSLDAKECILNDSRFNSIATLLNELFLSPDTINDEGHRCTLLSVVMKLEFGSTPTDQTSILSTIWLHTFTAIYFLQIGSEVAARRHIAKAAALIPKDHWLFNNIRYKLAYFGILRVCFEYGIEFPEDLATGKIHRGILRDHISNWICAYSRPCDLSYNIRRSIWISILAQGKTEFRKDIARLKNGKLKVRDINNKMHSWLQHRRSPEFPQLWDFYDIDRLSAIDAELKFLQPIYDVAIILAKNKSEDINDCISIIGNFTEKSIDYVTLKQKLLPVDRKCGFQKECNYLIYILQSFSAIGSVKFHDVTQISFYKLSSMVSKTWMYGNISTPPNISSRLAMARWNEIRIEERE